jgi:hypothetical protein
MVTYGHISSRMVTVGVCIVVHGHIWSRAVDALPGFVALTHVANCAVCQGCGTGGGGGCIPIPATAQVDS